MSTLDLVLAAPSRHEVVFSQTAFLDQARETFQKENAEKDRLYYAWMKSKDPADYQAYAEAKERADRAFRRYMRR